jgi:ferredoxin
VFRIKRWSECNHCRNCQKACEWSAIQGPKILQHMAIGNRTVSPASIDS